MLLAHLGASGLTMEVALADIREYLAKVKMWLDEPVHYRRERKYPEGGDFLINIKADSGWLAIGCLGGCLSFILVALLLIAMIGSAIFS